MIIKLNPGDKIHLTVTSTEPAQGQYGPQIKFIGTTPTDPDAVLFLNVDTAESQLARLGLTSATVIGQTVEIAKVEKNGRKFTDINRVNGAAPVPAAPARAVAPSRLAQAFEAGPRIAGLDPEQTEAAPSKLDGVLSLHDVCVMHAATHTVKLLKAQGFQPTAADILAAAATQMIGAQKVGASA